MVVIIWRHFQHEELVRPGIEPRVRRVQRRHVLAIRPPEVAAVVRILVLDPAGAVSYTYIRTYSKSRSMLVYYIEATYIHTYIHT